MDEADAAHMTNTRIGYLTAVEKYKEALTVADHVGGEVGACRRADAEMFLSSIYNRLGDTTAAVRAACSALTAARASTNRSMLVTALSFCGDAAKKVPSEMVNAEKNSREQEQRSGSSLYGGLDLSQEGRISLPTSPAALSRLSLAPRSGGRDLRHRASRRRGPWQSCRCRRPARPITACGGKGARLPWRLPG